MAREIKVTIRQDGTMMHEVNGVLGQGCFDFAKPLRDLIGNSENRLVKAEFWQTEKATLENREDQA